MKRRWRDGWRARGRAAIQSIDALCRVAQRGGDLVQLPFSLVSDTTGLLLLRITFGIFVFYGWGRDQDGDVVSLRVWRLK